jgi:hypothetical protein
VPESLLIPGRFNGPLESGNGGYSAGAIAAFLGDSAAVSLRRPVPLDTPLEVAVDDGTARVLDGEALVAEAERAPDFDLEAPEPPSPEEARRANAGYRGLADGPFSRCFVCGLSREDALGVFAGAVDGREMVASPWTPPTWAADEDGRVRSPVVWAVLDCPTYFAAHIGEDLTTSFLVRMTARIDAPVAVGEEHLVIAWPVASEGRKREAGSAVVSAAGETLAVASVLLVEPRA